VTPHFNEAPAFLPGNGPAAFVAGSRASALQ